MTFREEFEEGLQKYRRLNLSWTTATALVVAANLAMTVSYMLAVTLFVLGAINLGASGVSCAYIIAKENA